MQRHFKPGFLDGSDDFSVYSITIKPELYAIQIPQDTRKDVPFRVLRDLAADSIAEQLVSRLIYTKEMDETRRVYYHKFSVKDFTVFEREVSRQIIQGLVSDNKRLAARCVRLQSQYDQIYSIYVYNARSLHTKLIDWLLYDKPFTRRTYE